MSPEILELMMLRRATEGGVSVRDGAYTHRGRPVGGELAAAAGRLLAAGFLALSAPGPDGRRTVEVTVAGAVRLAEAPGGRRG